MEEFKKRQNGEVTIFLCLIFLVLLSLVAALLKSVSVRLEKNEERMRLEMAVESVFAEYNRDLLEEYEIFGLDAYSEEQLLQRLCFYGAANKDYRIRKITFLSDHKGEPFYQQAVQYMKNKYGLPETIDEESSWEEIENAGKGFLEEEEANHEQIEDILAEEDSPVQGIEEVKKQGLLKSVLPEGKEVSNLSIPKEQLASERDLRQGNCAKEHVRNVASDALFREYLLEQFYHCVEEKEIRSIAYETEYLLCGKGTDAKNLEKTLQKILLLRMVPNYTCLLSDPVRRNEANALAANFCLLIQNPAITPAVEQAVLFAWAYGESIAELQILMDGGTVATVKKKEGWLLPLSQLSLVGSLRYGKEKGEKNGMDYEEYLRVLLLLTTGETLCMRALDLIERDTGIKADFCITRLQVGNTRFAYH